MTRILNCQRCGEKIDVDTDGSDVEFTYIQEGGVEKVWHSEHLKLDKKDGIDRWQ